MSVGKVWERELLYAWQRHLEEGRSFVYRIRDNTYQKGRRMQSIKTPADLLVLSDHGDLLIECKARKAKSIPFDALAPHQAESLQSFSSINDKHVGVVAVLLYNGQRGKGRVHNGYLVPWWYWNMMDIQASRKSIPMAWLDASDDVVRLSWEKLDGSGKHGWVIPQDWHRILVPPAVESTRRQSSTEDTASVVGRRTKDVNKMIADARKVGMSSGMSGRGKGQQN